MNLYAIKVSELDLNIVKFILYCIVSGLKVKIFKIINNLESFSTFQLIRKECFLFLILAKESITVIFTIDD